MFHRFKRSLTDVLWVGSTVIQLSENSSYGNLEVGDRVKLILDKEISPDNKWHGETGTITRVTFDAAGDVTGDIIDSLIFEVELDSGESPDLHFRYDDLVLLEEHEAAMRE